MKLEQQINEITITNDVEGFFKGKEFEWTKIPRFAVITGINGSGKTQLLKAIHDTVTMKKSYNIVYHENKKITADDVYYHTINRSPKVLTQPGSLVDESNGKINIENFLVKSEDAINNMIFNDIHEHVEILKRLRHISDKKHKQWLLGYIDFVYAQNYIDEFHKIKDFKKSIKEYADDFLLHNNHLQEIQIFNVFMRYENVYTQLCRKYIAEDNRKLLIEKELSRKFGIDKAPWEVLNEILQKYEFKYQIQKNDSVNNWEFVLIQPNATGEMLEIDYPAFSTGEQIIFYLICLAYEGAGDLKNKIKLLLIDELDAYLNPTMSKMYIEILNDILVKKFNIQVIITTHTPSTAAYTHEKNLFWMENGKILSHDKKDKMAIIHQLITGLTPADDSCPFMSHLADPTKPYYILVEGYFDRIHITEACRKLGDKYKTILDECNFIQLGGTKGDKVYVFIENFAKGKNHNGDATRKTITLLDRDDSGNKLYNSIFKTSTNPNNIGILLEPNYTNEYKFQIEKGYIPIELLYPKEFIKAYDPNFLVKLEELNQQYYIEEITTEDLRSDNYFVVSKKADKQAFCEYIKNSATQEDFVGFQPTLDTILKTLNDWKK